ncbi:hypothetical protein K450DRAFT_247163 [Umbelopsis ramanniana AG]|uniref:Tudor domain-containing protein n=1 Tax=Umbelopsis ramanniana AG TaxID=1314678 RepID=A0AAD5E871_UMBRA|nr:uncharacterized protein K450DRAFT_247163 [Umbelopsis ramanniana AG]KAI8578494.1 hypothetical protein K450DRAFT_247163 [Umbelopsis ramanniana AG]
MSADEIAGYRYQLEQIEASLESDPQNSELIKLKNDLVELIALTTQFENVQSPARSAEATPTKTQEKPKEDESPSTRTATTLFQQYSVGQEVMAKYQADGKYYKAKISNVGGSGVVYSVIFAGYQDVEIVKAEDIKPIENKYKNKRPASNVESGDGTKKQPQAKKPKKPAAVEVKKNAWLNFATKAEKKKKTSAIPINKKSIFKTPDNPEGKVGVIGSGRGMTGFQQRGKHQYSSNSNVDEE